MQNLYRKKGVITVLTLIIALTMVLSCVFFIYSGSNNTAEAIIADTISTASTNLGEMLLDGYDSSGSGKVFNIKVFYQLISQITGVASPNDTTISSMTTPKTSADFRALNGGKDVVVTIGGKQWIATYLSTNSSGKPILTFWLANNATTSTWSVGTNNYKNNFANQYTSNLYGTSYIRTTTLNNGGAMADTNTTTSETAISGTMTTVTQDATNEWAIYTMDKTTAIGGQSLKEFLEVPNNMSWQLTQTAQNAVTYTNANYNFNNNNDAINAGGNSTTTGNYLTKLGTSLASYYKAWGADTLWLPSVAETGITGAEGIWMATNSTRANNGTSYIWLRSAYSLNYNLSYTLSPAGSSLSSDTVFFSNVVRPAFHLNLKLAAARAGTNAEEPTDVTVEYNGKSQTIADVADAQKSWYDSSLIKLTYPTTMTSAGEYTVTAEISDAALAEDPDLIFKGDPTKEGETATKRFFTFKITPKPLAVSWDQDDYGAYIPSLDPDEICGSDVVNLNVKYEGRLTASGAAYSSTSPPKNAGTYTVTIESLNNPNYVFETGTVMFKDFTIDIRKINLPTFKDWEKWYDYNGKTQLYFIDAASYKTDDIEITRPAEFTNNDFTFASNTISVKNVNAKDEDNWYYLTLTLKDKDNTVWAGTEDTEDKQLKFKILPYEIVIELNDDISTLSAMFEEDTDMYIEVTGDGIPTGHTLVFDISATFNGESYPLLSGLTLDEDSSRLSKTLLTSTLPAPNISYEVQFVLRDGEADNGNFHITCNSVTIKVEEEGSGRDTWRITMSTGGYFGSRFYTNMGTLSVDYTETITYNGTTYGIEFKPSTEGQSVDTTYNTDGYVKGYLTVGSSGNTAIGKNADTYTTYVRVIDSNNGNAIVTYQITWTISPYKFNLSGVTWKNDGKYEYTGSSISPSLEGLPSELKLSLQGAHTSGIAAKSYGNVMASFDIADGYVESNYILPENGEDGSYDGDFTWSISWEITPLQIKLTWTSVDETDENGVAYTVNQLKDTSLAGIVDYEYYLTDEDGNIIDDTPYTLDKIIVSSTATQYFKTKPVITMGNESNYKFPDGVDIYSPIYSIGGGATEITLTLTNDQYTYTGKAVSLAWKAGTPTASLNFKYYIGDAFGTAIDYVPTEVGTYWVEVTSKNSAVVLDGGSARFQFWINKSVIPTEWKTTAKPPVLANLKSIQLTEGIEYEYYDADMHKITFNDLSAGGTFYIRAILKDTKNFEFDNGDVQTETIQFTLAAGEELRDPSDISNPNYNFDDEDEDEDDDDEKPTIPLEWDTSKNPPELKIPDEHKDDIHPEYEYFDKDGNPVKPEDMVEGEDYTVKVTIPEDEWEKFNFVDKNGNTIKDPNDIPEYTFEKKEDKGQVDLGAFGDFMSKYWQPIVIGICIILIIIFLSKTAGYESKRKKYKKKADRLESSMFAAAAPAPLWGLAYNSWTALAVVAIILTIASLVIMIIAKYRSDKAEEEYEDTLEEYNRHKNDSVEQRRQDDNNRREEEYRRREEENRRRDDDMRMMFMNMFGGMGAQGMAQGMANATGDGQSMPSVGYVNMQPALGAAEIRGIVTETMTALLPGVQQTLPQPSVNNGLMEKIIEQNERLIQQLAEQKAQDRAIQEALIKKLLERDNAPQVVAPQVIEKEVVKEVPVEKIVEKEVKVEVPVEVEKIVEKEVPVEVERIIEKEVVKEVPVEKIVEKEVKVEVPVEVEKIVEVPVEVVKEVPIKVEVPVEVIKEVPVKSEPRPKKEVAPRLTLDEAYALLTKEQKKFFDGLKQYVLDKYKCKEKKTTYFVTYGQTSTNPLLKLMIKKNITVAMLKMEDELMKDIRRDATGDGTKVKVKETEILVTDAQAFETAKKMIDLRYDQIERYKDLLKEQRSLRR